MVLVSILFAQISFLSTEIDGSKKFVKPSEVDDRSLYERSHAKNSVTGSDSIVLSSIQKRDAILNTKQLDTWGFNMLEYRIPIILENPDNIEYPEWPIIVHFNFSNIDIKPYNYSLLLADEYDTTVDFQIINYKSNGSHLMEFDLVFIILYSIHGYKPKFFLYFSEEPKDLSAYNIDKGILGYEIINNNLSDMYIQNGSMVVSISSDPVGGQNVKVMEVYDGKGKYKFLLSPLNQTTGYIGNSTTTKQGLIRVEYEGYKIFDTPLILNESADNLSDLEDSLNGPYAFETHALYLYNASNSYFFGIYSPSLLDAEIKRIRIGKIAIQISFENTPLREYYYEGDNVSLLSDVTENITYSFYYYSGMIYKYVTINNNKSWDIIIEDNSTNLGGLISATYGNYSRYDASPQDIGSLVRYYFWYDDENKPEGSYPRMGSISGLPKVFDYAIKNDSVFVWGIWNNRSLGRADWLENASFILYINKSLFPSLKPTIVTGSYFVYPNASSTMIYDGMFNTMAFDFPSITINSSQAYSFDFTVVFGDDTEYSLIEKKMTLLSGGLRIANKPSNIANIQYNNSRIEITPTKIWDANNESQTNVHIDLYYDGVYILPYYIRQECHSSFYYVYVYSTVLTGNFTVVVYNETIFGMLNYTTNITISSGYENISLDVPLCDYEVIVLDPSREEIDPYSFYDNMYRDYSVNFILNYSNYTNQTGTWMYKYVSGETLIMKDLVLGNYTLDIFPGGGFAYGVPIDEERMLYLDWNTSVFNITVWADVARVNFIVVDSSNISLQTYTVNLSGIGTWTEAYYPNDMYIINFTQVPLANRTSAANVTLNATAKYYFLNVCAYSTLSFNVTENNQTFYIMISDVHPVFLFINTTDDANLIAYAMMDFIFVFVRNGTSDYMWLEYLYTNFSCFVIDIPDTSIYGLTDLYINVTYQTEDWDTVSNESLISPVTGPEDYTIDIPIVSYLSLNFYTHNGDIFTQLLQPISVDIIVGCVWFSTSVENGLLSLSDVPSDRPFNITSYYYTELGITIVNNTILYIDDNSLDIFFYVRNVPIFVCPQYNLSYGIPRVELTIYLNQTYVKFGTTNQSGILVLKECPSPIYQYNNMTIYLGLSIYDNYWYQNTIIIIVDETMYLQEIDIILPLKRVMFNITSPYGEEMDAIMEIYYQEASMSDLYLTELIVKDGIAYLELCPFDNLTIDIMIYTKWNFELSFMDNISVSNILENISIVAPLETFEISIYSLTDVPLEDAEVIVFIRNESNITIANAYEKSSATGLAIVDQIPSVGSTIIVNGSFRIVNNLLVIVVYNVFRDIYVMVNETLTSNRQTILLPLGELSISAYYNSTNGEIEIKNDTIVDLLIAGEIYKRIYLGDENVFDLVPLDVDITLVITFLSEYNVTITKSVSTTLNYPYNSLKIFVPIGDLTIHLKDLDNISITEVNVTIKSYGFVLDAYPDNSGYIHLYRIPHGIYEIEIIVDTGINMTYTQKQTISFHTASSYELIIKIRSITLRVFDEQREPYSGLLIRLLKGNYEINLISTTNEIPLYRIPAGTYVITIYYYTEGTVYPLNYTYYPLDISSVEKEVVFYASFAKLASEMVMDTDTVYQDEYIRVGTYVYDSKGNAIIGLQVFMELRDLDGNVIISNETIEESPGYYVGYLDIGKTRHGQYKIAFKAIIGEESVDIVKADFVVRTVPPEISFDPMQYLALGLIVIIFSLGVSLIQYKLSREKEEIPEKKIKSFITLYVLGMLISMLIFALPFLNIIEVGYQVLAYAVSFIFIIILYGLWIYIDGYRAVKLNKSSKMSIPLGILHMILPPYIMLEIIDVGKNIEWFEEYIIEQVSSIGPIQAPALFVSFLSAYVTTYLVIAISAYRDISRARNKVFTLSQHEVPEGIVKGEAKYQLRRLSGGIRIRLLIFLGMLGISLVSALPFLKNVALLIVVAPIVLLIIGPYFGYIITGYITRQKTDFGL